MSWQVHSTLCVWLQIKVKHADRFPILTVCQASFLDMWMVLEENWEAMWGNDEGIDLSVFSSFYYLRWLTLSSYWQFIMQVWSLLIAIAHERVLSFPSWWFQIKPKPINSAGWFLLWLNGPKSNNTFGLCQIPVPQCVCFPLCWKNEHRFCETSKGLVSNLGLGAIAPENLGTFEGKEAKML